MRRFTPSAHLTAALAGVLLGGCMRAISGGNGDGAALAAASWVSTTVTRAVSVVESPTISLALDRIDQRDPELDNRYLRRGTGAGVTVYVFDGGVSETHPELAGRVRRGFSAFPDDPPICNAHGTAVAGAIGGASLGVAPGVEIVDVKMVDCGRLRGTIQGIVEAAAWVLQDAKQHPGRRAIANWSFIADTAAHIPALDSAIAALTHAGIPVIVSAGNVETNACRISPANSPHAIAVGASAYTRDATGRALDRRAHGTAFGPCIDLYAPGDSVMLPSIGAQREPTEQLWNGTSMSAGYVSGAAALYLEANPTATPAEVADHLTATGTRNVVDGARSAASALLFVGTGNADCGLRAADATPQGRAECGSAPQRTVAERPLH